MKCDRCKTNEATTYYKQVINGNVKEYHLCPSCAAEMGTISYQPFSGLFGGLFSDVLETPNEERCPTCGMTYREISHTGKVGCAKCYDVFRNRMKGALENIHGNTKHMGKIPGNSTPPYGAKQEEKIDPTAKLKEQMSKAIEEQNFEEAARLRDEIRKIEGADHEK